MNFVNATAIAFTWWDDLGSVELKAQVIDQLVSGVTEKTKDHSDAEHHHATESAQRDDLIVAMLQAVSYTHLTLPTKA